MHAVAGIAGRVVRELARIGHQHAVGEIGQDRRHDDAGVGDDHHAQAFEPLAPPVAVERGDDMAARAGMHGHAQPAAADQTFEPLEFGKRQMRAADRHRVDRLGRRPLSTAWRAHPPPLLRVTSITASAGSPPSAVASIGRFRRDAGDVEQPDRAGRGGGRAERLQRVLARVPGDARHDADRVADLAAVEAAEHRPGDSRRRGTAAAGRPTSKTSVAWRFSAWCKP